MIQFLPKCRKTTSPIISYFSVSNSSNHSRAISCSFNLRNNIQFCTYPGIGKICSWNMWNVPPLGAYVVIGKLYAVSIPLFLECNVIWITQLPYEAYPEKWREMRVWQQNIYRFK